MGPGTSITSDKGFGRGVDYNDIFHIVSTDAESGSLPVFEPTLSSTALRISNNGLTITNSRDKEWASAIASPGFSENQHYWEFQLRELHSIHVMVMVGIVDRYVSFCC